MSTPIVHFVHGNSFPSGTYRIFLEHLRRHYEIGALPMHAHDPRYPVRDGWRELRDELLDELGRRYREPVILVGHSMGGVLSLMAAHKQPERVRCIVLLDAPVIAGWRALLLRVAKATGHDDRFSPARASATRRTSWRDREEAFEHYAAKQVFAAWPAEVLRDYVEHGTQAHPEGVTLAFDRDIETAVYRTLPHDIGRMVRGRFPVPVGFVGGTDSVECRMAGWEATKRLVGRHFRLIPGGHLFPMESPAAAAQALHEMIQALLSGR